MEINSYINQLPKAELHLHIEGTLEAELMFKLAHKNQVALPWSSIEETQKAYQFNNLQSFLNIYYTGASVLRTDEDFYELTWAYLEKAKSQNICHTEIFFDPQTHTNRGIYFDTVINGIYEALKIGQERLGVSSKLILCFLRDLDIESARKTLDMALKHQDKIIGIGLDSAEKNNPPVKFKEVFEQAKAAGFLTVAHAGEEGTSDYIWQAINLLKVSRIDHGVRCIHDRKLMDYLAEMQIPLTICPLSNVKLKVFNSLAEHNLKKLLDYGLCVTVNSDDPAYFGGYINENFLGIAKALDLNKNDLFKLVENSFKAAFLTEEDQAKLVKQLQLKVNRIP